MTLRAICFKMDMCKVFKEICQKDIHVRKLSFLMNFEWGWSISTIQNNTLCN